MGHDQAGRKEAWGAMQVSRECRVRNAPDTVAASSRADPALQCYQRSTS